MQVKMTGLLNTWLYKQYENHYGSNQTLSSLGLVLKYMQGLGNALLPVCNISLRPDICSHSPVIANHIKYTP